MEVGLRFCRGSSTLSQNRSQVTYADYILYREWLEFAKDAVLNIDDKVRYVDHIRSIVLPQILFAAESVLVGMGVRQSAGKERSSPINISHHSHDRRYLCML